VWDLRRRLGPGQSKVKRNQGDLSRVAFFVPRTACGFGEMMHRRAQIKKMVKAFLLATFALIATWDLRGAIAAYRWQLRPRSDKASGGLNGMFQ